MSRQILCDKMNLNVHQTWFHLQLHCLGSCMEPNTAGDVKVRSLHTRRIHRYSTFNLICCIVPHFAQGSVIWNWIPARARIWTSKHPASSSLWKLAQAATLGKPVLTGSCFTVESLKSVTTHVHIRHSIVRSRVLVWTTHRVTCAEFWCASFGRHFCVHERHAGRCILSFHILVHIIVSHTHCRFTYVLLLAVALHIRTTANGFVSHTHPTANSYHSLKAVR